MWSARGSSGREKGSMDLDVAYGFGNGSRSRSLEGFQIWYK